MTNIGGTASDGGEVEHFIAEVFRAAGYATAAYGKWHSGMPYPFHPNARIPATEVAGNEVAEMRLLMFRRLFSDPLVTAVRITSVDRAFGSSW